MTDPQHAAPVPDVDLPAGEHGSVALRERAEAVLRQLVGREDSRLRDDQWLAIEALVAHRRRALVVQRTGWGKSAVYFVATALLRSGAAGPTAGPTVIVSPLLALMRNQVTAAARAGIVAETINSANVTDWESVHARVAAGEVDVLLVSPERLNNPRFRDEVLPRLAADTGLLVVDEAHCISDWGHDFRPDYRRIRTLLAELPVGIPVLATTATANARVTADVAEQLAVTGADASDVPARSATSTGSPSSDVLVLRGPLDRETLHLSVERLEDHASRLAWLSANLPRISGSGIVYCLTVAMAEQVAAHLRADGLEVRAYSGQTDPAEREAAEEDLLANRVKALVATSALGMGFDKPDLAFVVHLGAPSSPIAYYQQVGRAGRATKRAEVVLLPGAEDQQIWDWFASQSFPAERQVRETLDALEALGTLSLPALETHVDLRRSRLEAMLKVLDVDGAVRRVAGGWQATGAGWTYDAERYERVDAARRAEQDAMLAYESSQVCRLAFLRGALDDPELELGWRCGRCDRCGGATEFALPEATGVATAREHLDAPGVEIAARRQWPSGMASLGIDLSGRIPPEEQARPGRAVGRLDALGWGGVLRELFDAPGGQVVDPGELPVSLRRAVLDTLDAWAPAVTGVAVVGSATRPGLVTHLAEGVARHLGVPLVARALVHGAPPRHDVNSAQRLAGVARRLGLE
ncbi:MAG: DEAD/DEAH box helicase, partial [Actinomycetota bacterium]|nr:DEAD/DEAH box helicase [Actinomycetota bacterium]